MRKRLYIGFILGLLFLGLIYQTFYEKSEDLLLDCESQSQSLKPQETATLGSTGHLYRAQVVRTYEEEEKNFKLLEEKHPRIGFSCPQWIILTTIQPPTPEMLQLSELEDWCMVVVADRKTPENYLDTFSEDARSRTVYLTPSIQESLPYQICKLLPWNHYGRKNIGYLYAIHHGAKVIYDTDDDNKLTTEFIPTKIQDYNSQKQIVLTDSSVYAFNLYPLYSPVAEKNPTNWSSNIWPRGFPLEKIKISSSIPSDFVQLDKNSPPSVIQILQQHDPDVDALYRLTEPLPFQFKSQTKDLLNLPKNVFAPFNAQSSVFYEESLWGLYLPITVTGRVSDIWRSYISQRLLWDANYTIAYAGPRIIQERNPHSYLADLNAESDLYAKSDEFLRFLLNWTSPETNFLKRYYNLVKDLYTINIFEKEDVLLVKAWISDLQNINYKISHRSSKISTNLKTSQQPSIDTSQSKNHIPPSKSSLAASQSMQLILPTKSSLPSASKLPSESSLPSASHSSSSSMSFSRSHSSSSSMSFSRSTSSEYNSPLPSQSSLSSETNINVNSTDNKKTSCSSNPIQCERKASHWIVLRSTDITHDFTDIISGFDSDWQIIIIEVESAKKILKKSSSYIYLSIEDQKNLCFSFVSICLQHSECDRRNIGHLYAITCGAKYIHHTIILDKSFLTPMLDSVSVLANTSKPNFNPFRWIGMRKLWPQGYPDVDLKNVTNEFYNVYRIDPIEPLIVNIVSLQQASSLSIDIASNHSSDHHLPLYDNPQALMIPLYAYVSLDSYNTRYSSSTFFGLLQPPSINEYLRGDIQQKILQSVGNYFISIQPEHNSSVDWVDFHNACYEHTCQVNTTNDPDGSYRKKVQNILDSTPYSESYSFSEYLSAIYEELEKNDVLSSYDLNLLNSWLFDLNDIGHLSNISISSLKKNSNNNNNQNNKKHNDIAICFTGQVDRSPQAIFPTIQRLENWYSDGFDVFYYLSTFHSLPSDKDWLQGYDVVHGIIYDDIPLTLNKTFTEHDFNLKKGWSINNVLQQLYGELRCYQMVEDYCKITNQNYKGFIRLRSDTLLKEDLTGFSFADVVENKTVFLPEHFSWHGYNDRFAVGPYEEMRYYMTRYLEMTSPDVETLHAETYLKFSLDKHHVNVVQEPIEYIEVPSQFGPPTSPVPNMSK